MDAVFRALADPTRRKLLDRLFARGPLTLSQLTVRLRMSRQAVTQHLDILEEANLVSVRWRGREKLHVLNPVPLYAIAERWVRKFEERHLAALADLKTEIEGARHAERDVSVRDLHRGDARARLGRASQTRVHKNVLGA
jgi:DNA-binding transcriptional ArsR family regulator